MSKIPYKKVIKDMKYIEGRDTLYSNHFPANCGYIYYDGSISFDCIGLIKSYINNPSIAYKTSPAGYYVEPGQVIGDWGEIEILNHCTDVSANFTSVPKASYLYMPGHAGLFVGQYVDPSGIVNTIECTAAMGGGVKSSYTDKYGYRYDHKGGECLGRWEKHGKLSAYIEYAPVKKKTTKQIAQEVIDGKWGVYPLRKIKLEEAGYNYLEVQKLVNQMLK